MIVFELAISNALGGLDTVTDSGFEVPALADNPFTNDGTVSGWTGVGVVGVWNLPVASYASVPEGVRIAYLNAGGSLTQDLGVSSFSGGTYTLPGWIGNRSGAGPGATGTIELSFAGAPVITLAVNPPNGTFVNLSGFYVASSSGEATSIRLTTSGRQANFGAIGLNAVPEPGAHALVGPDPR